MVHWFLLLILMSPCVLGAGPARRFSLQPWKLPVSASGLRRLTPTPAPAARWLLPPGLPAWSPPSLSPPSPPLLPLPGLRAETTGLKKGSGQGTPPAPPGLRGGGVGDAEGRARGVCAVARASPCPPGLAPALSLLCLLLRAPRGLIWSRGPGQPGSKG